jgi:hypothetical protein
MHSESILQLPLRYRLEDYSFTLFLLHSLGSLALAYVSRVFPSENIITTNKGFHVNLLASLALCYKQSEITRLITLIIIIVIISNTPLPAKVGTNFANKRRSQV